jgi:2-desacetyl-2-hydroxyethyl bacteriochlorophyllide A dehydrogenase
MFAAVKKKDPFHVEIEDVPMPECGANQVLIQVKYVGICGSDVSIFSNYRNVPPNFVAGHEFSGVIVETGASVKKYKKGDRVIPSIIQSCSVCHYCREGLDILCDDLIETGIHVQGAFAEYVAVNENCVHPLPDGMDFVAGAAVDPIASAYRPVKNAHIGSRDEVVVFGPGPIGLYALQIAKAEGAKKTIVVGTRESRLEIARNLGADMTINTGEKKENAVEKIREYTNGKMADVIVEATGVSGVMEDCINGLGKNGRLSLAGIFHEPCSLDATAVVRKELQIRGNICYTYNDFSHCIHLLESGKVKTEGVVSHVMDLKDIGEALRLIRERLAIKVILKV